MQNLVQPEDMFGEKLNYFGLFVKWFNNSMESKLAKGLSKVERVEHKLVFPKAPDECIDKRGDRKWLSVQDAWNLKSTLKKTLDFYGYTFKYFRYNTSKMAVETVLTWDSAVDKVNYRDYDLLKNATILKKYELDDDEGFIDKLNSILKPENEGKLFTRDIEDRTLSIYLNAFDRKYIFSCNTDLWARIYYLYDRYEKILEDNNDWRVDYRDNESIVFPYIPEKATLILKDITKAGYYG